MNKPLFSILTGIIILFSAPLSALAADPVYTSRFNNNAAGGYDVVAYFTEGAPVKGSAEFETDYDGAKMAVFFC